MAGQRPPASLSPEELTELMTLQMLFMQGGASWPDEASLSGKFSRVKRNDHILDPLEHVLGRRPYGRRNVEDKVWGSWLASQRGKKRVGGNVHLGNQ